jgi:hypothetical protein
VQQRIVVARTLLAGVPQRLIPLRPLFVRAATEVSDGHAIETIRRRAGSLPDRLSVTRITSGGGSVYVLCRDRSAGPILPPRLSGISNMAHKHKISTMTDSGRKSGRAVFDNQGRASWEWQTATGVFQTDVTNAQLQGLEAAGLAVVETEQSTTSGRVWANVGSAKIAPRANNVVPARNPTVLKRLLRRLSG